MSASRSIFLREMGCSGRGMMTDSGNGSRCAAGSDPVSIGRIKSWETVQCHQNKARFQGVSSCRAMSAMTCYWQKLRNFEKMVSFGSPFITPLYAVLYTVCQVGPVKDPDPATKSCNKQAPEPAIMANLCPNPMFLDFFAFT